MVVSESVAAKFLKKRYAFQYEFLTHPTEFVEALQIETSKVDAILAGGYSLASELEYYFRGKGVDPLPVFGFWGEGSRFGRNYDWTLDWNALEGKTIAIVTPAFLFHEHGIPYFRKFDIQVKNFRGVEYMVGIGEGFKAKDYESMVARPAWSKYYPDFLPGVCTLKETAR
jgi:hypothetical protein